jgi:hypothetical protein
MNSESIYTVMLSKEYPFAGRDYPLFGFSYQIRRESEAGEVKLIEFGHPTRIVLWDKDGPELADLTEEQVKARIEEVLSA